MEARLGLLEKCLIAAFATGLLFAFRYPLVIDPIAHAVTARQQAFHDDVQAARDRVALEDTARFINESMPSSAYSPTKFDLLKKSVAAAKLNGLFCEFGVYKGTTAPVNKATPAVTKQSRPLPGEEYETAKPLPPLQNVVEELPPTSSETLPVPENSANTTEAPLEPQDPANAI
jgi:hypothetical protein